MQKAVIEYFGREWSFNKVKTLIDQTANAFSQFGIKCGDTVLVGLSNTPEAVISLLPINKMGTVSKCVTVQSKDSKDSELCKR